MLQSICSSWRLEYTISLSWILIARRWWRSGSILSFLDPEWEKWQIIYLPLFPKMTGDWWSRTLWEQVFFFVVSQHQEKFSPSRSIALTIFIYRLSFIFWALCWLFHLILILSVHTFGPYVYNLIFQPHCQRN